MPWCKKKQRNKPLRQRRARAVKHRTSRQRNLVSASFTLKQMTGMNDIGMCMVTTRAAKAVRPPSSKQSLRTRFLCAELLLELRSTAA